MTKTDTKTDEAIQLVRDFLNSGVCTRYALSKKAGVSEFVLRDVFSETFNPYVDNLRKLEKTVSNLLEDSPNAK